MSAIAPSSLGRAQSAQKQKQNTRHNESHRIYAHPLPLLFLQPPPSPIRSLFTLLGLPTASILDIPHCDGIFDPATRSVWVSNPLHVRILWQRGFFGKGHLSRSEPSWLARQIHLRATPGNQLTSEEVTAKRRAERKQFKLDRARAIAVVAEEAELLFATEGRVVAPALSGPAIPSAATWRPAVLPASPAVDDLPISPAPTLTDDEPPLEDVEHLQLTLQEAFFLLWTLDCLHVLSPHTHDAMRIQSIWIAFQRAHIPPFPLLSTLPSFAPLRFDNPFLINYVAYHHYRSLGWVVKGGIKFCVDYLLYKRGPVFTHAEFALVICPVYEDPEDQTSSPFDLPNAAPFSWSWLSTINRVNSQVQKTLILVYVTIPAQSRRPISTLNSPACLELYSVREVILRRFVPARMRD